MAAEVATGIETHVRIPMLGVKRSLNVATAAGIVLYELLRRRWPAAISTGWACLR